MKSFILFIFAIFYYITKYSGNATEIHLLSYTFNSGTFDESSEEKQFDEYARKNNLNITLKLEMTKFENPSDSYTNFKSLVESSLKKSNDRTSINEIMNNKYDLYIYNNKYTNIYAPYLIDLKKHLPKEYIEMFNSKVVKETCTYENKLNKEDEVVGLPTYVSYNILYSNIELLSKYNKPIPKTWDELINTCEYIMEKEKNDTELICYNGLFDESEEGLYSLYEFIYSCRNLFNSTYPKPDDPVFANSLKLLKKLKEKLAADDIFKSNEKFTFSRLMSGKSLFLKYWFVGQPLLSDIMSRYKLSILPGLKEGISGASITGNNIGIIRNITDDKIEASIEVLKYYISKERQKETFNKRLGLIALDELLNDDELCKDEICDIIKDIQFTAEPKFIMNDGPEDYRKRYQKYIYQFLYNNKTKVDETLKQIKDITKIYYIYLGTDDSYVGLIFFIISLVLSIIMLLSLIVLFKNNFRLFFMFLPEDLWILTVFGSILLLWIPYINYGEVETVKCHLRPLFMAVGFTLSVCPTFYKLIALFPEENKITRLVVKHKYLFLLFNFIIDISLCGISLANPYTSQFVFVKDGESFEKCKFNGIYSIIIPFIYKLLVILLMLFLVFVEWNISTTVYDMKPIVMIIYIDVLFIILIFVFHIINIKNYIGYFILQSISTFVVSLSNYIFIYGIRVFLGFVRKKDIKLQFINNINEKFVNEKSLSEIKKTVDTNGFCSLKINESGSRNLALASESTHKKKFITRMIDYHYMNNNISNNISSSNTTSIVTTTMNSYN